MATNEEAPWPQAEEAAAEESMVPEGIETLTSEISIRIEQLVLPVNDTSAVADPPEAKTISAELAPR